MGLRIVLLDVVGWVKSELEKMRWVLGIHGIEAIELMVARGQVCHRACRLGIRDRW